MSPTTLDYSKPPPGYEVNGQWWRTATTQQDRWWGAQRTSVRRTLRRTWVRARV